MNTGLPIPPRCSRAHCQCDPETALDSRLLCRKHFIAECYAKLDQIDEQIQQKKLHGVTLESFRSVLVECTSNVTSQALRAPDLTNQERAQLLDILLSAAEILNHLRRSARLSRLVPVRLVSELSSDTWIEETVTQELSKHGAMLRCTHAYPKGETIKLVRLDTGQNALARVVWREKEKFAQHRVAVEILNSSNFWNWSLEAGRQI